MSIPMMVGALLGLAVSAATLRQLFRWLRLPPASRPATWRMGSVLLLQAACAALLYCTLLPPQRAIEHDGVVVLTAGAGAMLDQGTGDAGDVVIALPEADVDAAPGIQRVPDLATALRMHPGATRLHVVGSGLTARDIEAAKELALEFEAAPIPRGFIALHVPARVVAGGILRVAGRVHGVESATVELLDPAGTVVERRAADAAGRFLFEAPAGAQGRASWRLRLRAGDAADGAVIEEAEVPAEVVAGADSRILLLAGAPNPEVKYLRRWATDAGLVMHSRMALGAGVVLGDGPVTYDAATLAGFDLAIIDERAWSALAAGERAALLAAVDQGLGLLLRITLPPGTGTRQAVRELGFTLEDDVSPGGDVRLESKPWAAAGGVNAGDVPGIDRGPPALARQPVALVAPDGVVLLRDRESRPLAMWRGAGRGRIAVWNLDQSFRLVLTGHGAEHARLWGGALGTLARARAATPPEVRGPARVGQRMILCGVKDGDSLVAEDGTRLQPLPAPGADGCTAVWPTRAGWHRIAGRDGAAAFHLHVRDAAALPGVDAYARHEATMQLAGAAAAATGTAMPPRTAAGPRWPWFLAWLTVAGLLWWLERARHGLGTRPGAGRRVLSSTS